MAEMTPERLTEIRYRAASLREYMQIPQEADQLADVDVPDLLAEVEQLRTDRDRHAEQVQRVRALHAEHVHSGTCQHCWLAWPCPTRRALDAEEGQPPLVERIADAILAHLYPVTEWPDGPPGEGEADSAREEAEAIVKAICEVRHG